MRVFGVRQQVDVELKRDIAHRGDLVLRRASSVQEPRGGKLKLLQREEAQALREGSFNLIGQDTSDTSAPPGPRSFTCVSTWSHLSNVHRRVHAPADVHHDVCPHSLQKQPEINIMVL